MNLILFSFVVSVTITITTTKSLTPSIQPEFRIIGGDSVTIEQVPYQVFYYIDGNRWCGGTIISETVILTAAHCVFETNADRLSVLAGSTDLNANGDGNKHKVSKVYVHENFDTTTLDYDVALLVLETPLRFSEKIKSIPLPDEEEYLEEKNTVTISGWGHPQDNEQHALVLQAITIPVIKQNICEKLYSNYNRKVTPRMLCAGNIEGGKDHCWGDSGGPVVSDGKVHGIVSWANHVGCAKPFYPGVNTRVTAVRQWIRSKVDI